MEEEIINTHSNFQTDSWNEELFNLQKKKLMESDETSIVLEFVKTLSMVKTKKEYIKIVSHACESYNKNCLKYKKLPFINAFFIPGLFNSCFNAGESIFDSKEVTSYLPEIIDCCNSLFENNANAECLKSFLNVVDVYCLNLGNNKISIYNEMMLKSEK